MRETPDPSSALIAGHRRIGETVFAFTSRQGGVSAAPYNSLNLGLHVGDSETCVHQNRGRVLKALGVPARSLAEAEQVHGARVEHVCPASWSRGGRVAAQADALATSDAAVVLLIKVADCTPVFLTDGEGNIALAHAGWRGTTAGIAGETVGTMVGHGVQPSRLHAVIGPCVGVCCYEVGEEVVEGIAASLPGREIAEQVIRGPDVRGKWHVDLARANALQLQAVGIPAGQIETIGRCTCCENDTFFSVRGDGPTTGRCGALAYVE
jgi:YfiH family protein